MRKYKQRIQKFEKTGDSQCIYQKKQIKLVLHMIWLMREFKDIARRTASDRILRDKAFNTAKSPKYDGYQRVLASVFYKFFDKKTPGSGIKNNNISNKELSEELHIPIMKKFKKTKVQSRFIDNIAHMQLISKFHKEFRFLLCVIDIYGKYVLVIPLRDKNDITITNAFQKIFNESKGKPNKIRVDEGSQFYNRSIKSWLEKNDIEMCSTHNDGKSVIAEIFNRTLKNKSYKDMTSVSKNAYIDKLDDIVKKYNNTNHSTIKMKLNLI